MARRRTLVGSISNANDSAADVEASAELPEPSQERSPAGLSTSERARGRRLAITSHPAGMTFHAAFTGDLATLALVSLGATESLVGLHSGLRYGSQVLQLPTLRLVGRFSKRHLLLWGHLAALLASAPLIGFAWLREIGPWALPIILFCLVGTTAAIQASNTVWFPLLRGYVEPDRIGSFFGLIRSGWHLMLILYFGAATLWLDTHQAGFGPLFASAWVLGLLRVAFLVRLPERDERTGTPLAIRHALHLVRAQPRLRRYLIGIVWSGAVRVSVLPFALVMLRREIGLTNAQVVYTTVATFTGGLISLYAWGRIIDRTGPIAVFRFCAIGMGALYLALLLPAEPSTNTLLGVTGFFLLNALLAAGYGIADTRLLFELTPPEAPTRTLVVAQVTANVLIGAAPLLAGLLIDAALAQGRAPLDVYRAFFAIAAVLQALSFLPLRGFGQDRSIGRLEASDRP